MKTTNIHFISLHHNPVHNNTYKEYKIFGAQHVIIQKTNVSLSDIAFDKTHPVFLEIQHDQLTTLLDWTNCKPYEIWYFNEKLEFTGKAFSIGEASGSFIIQTQAKYILLWNTELNTKTSEYLASFRCSYFEWQETAEHQFTSQNFSTHYGRFPYVIIKQENSPCFSQIPVHINPVSNALPGISIVINAEVEMTAEEIEQIMVEHVTLVQQKESEKQNRNVKVALVINANTAYYFEQDKEPILNSAIPSGGVLLDVEGQIIAKNTEHYNQL